MPINEVIIHVYTYNSCYALGMAQIMEILFSVGEPSIVIGFFFSWCNFFFSFFPEGEALFEALFVCLFWVDSFPGCKTIFFVFFGDFYYFGRTPPTVGQPEPWP